MSACVVAPTAERVSASSYRCTGCGRTFSAYDMIANSRSYVTGGDQQKFFNLNAARAKRHAKACKGPL